MLIPVFIVIGIFGLFVLLYLFSPKSIDPENREQGELEYTYGQEVKDLPPLVYFEEFEKKYKKGSATEEDYVELSKQLKDLHRFMMQNLDQKHFVDLDYTKYKTIHDDFYGLIIYQEVEKLIQAIAELERAEKLEEAYEYSKTAWEKQKELHEEYDLSQYVNFNRLSNLEVETLRLKAKPLYSQSVALAEKAQAQIKEGQFLEALDNIVLAGELQDEINRRHSSSIYVNTQRLLELDAEAQKIQSGTLSQKVKQLLQESDKLMEQESFQKAAERITEARALQEEIHEKYPQSPFVDSTFLLSLERRRQSTLGKKEYLAILEGAKILKDLVRQNQLDTALTFMGSLEDQVVSYEQAYPRSLDELDQVSQMINLLKELSSELKNIQKTVNELLVKVVSYDEVYLSKVEVPQSLYEKVMGSNPSREKGETLPVQAVTFIEAMQFCERLTLLMGEKVRLPEPQEWRNWMSLPEGAVIDEYVWFIENSESRIREAFSKKPNELGLYNGLGNASEWVGNEVNESGRAFYEASDVLTQRENVLTPMINEAPPNERNRWRGFRFVLRKTLF